MALNKQQPAKTKKPVQENVPENALENAQTKKPVINLLQKQTKIYPIYQQKTRPFVPGFFVTRLIDLYEDATEQAEIWDVLPMLNFY